VPALIARELLIRVFRIVRPKLVLFLTVSICLAISAAYELIEWAAALAMGQGADEFLGTQGDQWDTQSDMAMALLGALAATLLYRAQDRQISKLNG
jgi:putative membrane protein